MLILCSNSPFFMAELDPLELAYFAGLFDGEGTIGVYKMRHKVTTTGFQYTYTVAISNSDPRPLRRLTEIFQGTICRAKVKSYRGRPFIHYSWTVAAIQAETFLRIVLPFLRIKKEQAELFLEARKFVSKGHRRNLLNESRLAEISERMKELKRPAVYLQ